MLTPIDIQNKVLKTGMGYNKKDVDDFIIEIMRNYEALYKENVELKDKISTLSEGIQYYKSIETTLQKALVLAEKTSKETRDAAIVKAEALEKEARVKANIIIADAKNDLESIRNQTINLIQNYESFRLQFKKLAATQMELIESESFQIYAPDLDSLLSGEEAPLNVTDTMAEYYPDGSSAIVKETIAQSEKTLTPQEEEARQQAATEAYEKVMEESSAQLAKEAAQAMETPEETAQTTHLQGQPIIQNSQPIQQVNAVQSTYSSPVGGQADTSASTAPQTSHTFMSTADLTSELAELQSYGRNTTPVQPQLQSIAEPVVENVAPQINYTESTAPAPNQMTEVMDNHFISEDLKQEGREVDQMINNLYSDLNTRNAEAQTTQAQQTATTANDTSSDDGFEFISTED